MMSLHEEYILNVIYYDATVNKYLSKTTISRYAKYGYHLNGLSFNTFPAFLRENHRVFIYDYEPLKSDKYFLELVRNYYELKVIKDAFVEHIKFNVQNYIEKHATRIELTHDVINGTTFISDTISKNVAILNDIYIEAQNEYVIKELTR